MQTIAEYLDEQVKNMKLSIVLKPGKSVRQFTSFDDLNRFFQTEYNFWYAVKSAPQPLLGSFSQINRELITAAAAPNSADAEASFRAALVEIRKQQQQPVIYSSTPEAQLVSSLAGESVDTGQGALSYFLGSQENISRLIQPQFFRGYAQAAFYGSPSLIGLDAERGAMERLRSDHQALVNQLRSDAERIPREINEFASRKGDELDKLAAEFRLSLQSLIDEWAAAFSRLDVESKQNFKETAELYQEKLRLEGPAVYWKSIAVQYERKGKMWVIWTVLLGLLSFALIALILYRPPEIFNADLSKTTTVRGILLLAFSASVLAYVLHLFVRLSTSAYHLSRDAQEREQLTYVFLALVKEKAITDADRNVVLSAIFSRSDTGLIRGEGSPAMPGTLGVMADLFKGTPR